MGLKFLVTGVKFAKNERQTCWSDLFHSQHCSVYLFLALGDYDGKMSHFFWVVLLLQKLTNRNRRLRDV